MRVLFFIPVVLALAAAPACGPSSQLGRAKKLEKKGKYYEAWQKYQAVAARHPGHPTAPEALFRSGWLAQRHMDDCFMATAFYDRVLESYPQSEPWAKAAVHLKNNCPDYFPLWPQMRWVEGDSESKGKNARIETECVSVDGGKKDMPSQKGILKRTYFAGDNKFKTTAFLYKKEAEELLEFLSEEDPRAKVILKWPLEVGTRWATKMEGRQFNYDIVAIDKKVEVAAGSFDQCVQVRSSIEGLGGATMEYYAPGVGRVMTTIVTQLGEKPNTELLSVKRPDITELEF